MNRQQCCLSVALYMACIACLSPQLIGSEIPLIRAVAVTGQQAPGLPARTFSHVGFGDFSNGNLAGFLATTSGQPGGLSESGVWTEGMSLHVVAREREPAPGTAGETFERFDTPHLTDDGRVAFLGFLQGTVPLGERAGFWTDLNGPLAKVYRNGDPIPGNTSGLTIQHADIRMNGSGAIVVRGTVGGAGVNLSNDRAIWSVTGGTTWTQVARKGDQAPQLEAGTVFDDPEHWVDPTEWLDGLFNALARTINEQAQLYGLPFGGAVVSLPDVVRALHDLLADKGRRLLREDDDMLLGNSNSPALERYREEKAALARALYYAAAASTAGR